MPPKRPFDFQQTTLRHASKDGADHNNRHQNIVCYMVQIIHIFMNSQLDSVQKVS